MTYNQLIKYLTDLLQSHAMIKSVENQSPQEWFGVTTRDIQFPVACFTSGSGSLNKGQLQNYNVTFWFLDKSGQEGLFEKDVVSDQHGIAYDIITRARVEDQPWIVPDDINFDVAFGQFEDYISGVTLTIDLETNSNFTACDMPLQ